MIRHSSPKKPKVTSVIPNTYKVPMHNWETWPPSAQEAFNTVFGEVAVSKEFLAPGTAKAMDDKDWHRVCWNLLHRTIDEITKDK